MYELRIILAARLRILAATLFDRRQGGMVRNIATLVVLAALLVGVYQFFQGIVFRYLADLEEIGFLLMDRMVSVAFLGFFFMLVISSCIASLSMLFRSDETEYLFSTPLRPMVLFTGKYVDVVLFSSWPILLMSLPILYAYARVRAFGALEYALTSFAVVLPFLVTASAIGTLVAIISVHASRRMSFWTLAAAAAAALGGIVAALVTFSRPTDLVVPFTEDYRSLNLFINSFNLNAHPFTPNFWLIQSLRALVKREPRAFVLYAGSLVTSAAFGVSLLYAVADRLFVPVWQATKQRAGRQRLDSFRAGGLTLRPTDSPVVALSRKDAILFVRDPSQWTQFFLLTALLVLYFVNLSFIPEDIDQWRGVLMLMNMGFCGFVLATLAVRFVFPLFSLEGDAFWVLGTAPVSSRTIFRQKLAASFFPFVIFGEIIAIVSGTIMHLDLIYQTITATGIFLMSAALASLAVGFGAAFPDFTDTNPSRIASGSGGVLTIVAALAYIAAMLALAAWPGIRYTSYLLSGGTFPAAECAGAAVGALVLSALAMTGPLMYGARRFAQREY